MKTVFGIMRVLIGIGWLVGVHILLFWLLIYASLAEIALVIGGVIGAEIYVMLIDKLVSNFNVTPVDPEAIAWAFCIAGFILFLWLWSASGNSVILGVAVFGIPCFCADYGPRDDPPFAFEDWPDD